MFWENRGDAEMSKTREYLAGQCRDLAPRYNGLGDSGDYTIALFPYVYLAEKFGWETYQAVFAHYESTDMAAVCSTPDDKMDQWVMVFSTVTQSNLAPFFQHWGWSLSATAIDTCQAFAPAPFSQQSGCLL
jgi:hypothetical protein